MQAAVKMHATKESILEIMNERCINEECYAEMLDYTIDLFEKRGLGTSYYGYHNIRHELEVTYMTLLSMHQNWVRITQDEARHIYVAALFHDLDPLKNVDKPHEDSVLSFISKDQRLQNLVKKASIDFEIVKVLILRTTYPWSGKMKEDAENRSRECFAKSDMTKDDIVMQHHIMDMGRYLSVVDRISGYALGDFARAMEMAKMNAHALAWRPALIVCRSVAYFEDLLNNETYVLNSIMDILPKPMRKNFYNTALSFFQARQNEIRIQAEHAYENLKLVPTIEPSSARYDPGVIAEIYDIYQELPTPLQFEKESFEESVKDPQTILTTLRINDCKGKIVGFAKGGPLERYTLRDGINDDHCGRSDTVFLEPMGVKVGYWGLKGGRNMRNMFIMQATAKKFRYFSSFALRDILKQRIDREKVEFIAQFDPERWDYYRMRI